MSQILIISDLHIGVKNKLNDFYIDEMKFVDYLYKHTDIYINGDIFDLLNINATSYEDIESNATEIIKDRKYLIDAFADLQSKHKLTLITGEYDGILNKCNYFNSCGLIFEQSKIVELGEYNIYISHGHQAEYWKNTLSLVNSNNCNFGIFSKPKIVNKIQTDLIDYELDLDLNNLNKLKGIDDEDLLLHAGLIANKYDYDVCIYGHTHESEIKELQYNKVYINTGKADIYGRDYIEAVKIDYEGGILNMRIVRDDINDINKSINLVSINYDKNNWIKKID